MENMSKVENVADIKKEQPTNNRKKPGPRGPRKKKKMTITQARVVINQQNQGAMITPEMSNAEIIEFAESLPKIRKCRVIITDKEDAGPGAFVSVNGEPVQLKRGEEIVITEPMLEVLKNAVRFSYRTVEKEDKTGTKAVPTLKAEEQVTFLGWVEE